jgi:hypothetical protein
MPDDEQECGMTSSATTGTFVSMPNRQHSAARRPTQLHLVVGVMGLALVAAVGCGEPPAVVVAAPATLPDLGHKQPWAPAACVPGQLAKDVLACVDGVPVTRADYDRVVDAYPAGTAPAAIVTALVDAELLAAAARKDKLWGQWLLPSHAQAMVRAYLRDKFELNYTWEDVAQGDLQRAWRDWGIRIRYVREPSFFATDAQFLCCSGDWRKCAIDQAAIKCIDEFAPKAQALYEILKADPPASPLEMKGKVYAVGHNFPRATIVDVDFYYLPDVPHDEQVGRGYTVMVESYATAVTALKPGEISKPIRSPFGWHITRLDKILPQLKGKVTDPHVRKEIAENILPLVRRRDSQRHAYELMKRRNVGVFFDEAIKKS